MYGNARKKLTAVQFTVGQTVWEKNRHLLIHQYENNEFTQKKLKLKFTLVKSHWCYVTKIHISVRFKIRRRRSDLTRHQDTVSFRLRSYRSRTFLKGRPPIHSTPSTVFVTFWTKTTIHDIGWFSFRYIRGLHEEEVAALQLGNHVIVTVLLIRGV